MEGKLSHEGRRCSPGVANVGVTSAGHTDTQPGKGIQAAERRDRAGPAVGSGDGPQGWAHLGDRIVGVSTVNT